jgi:Subtilase family
LRNVETRTTWIPGSRRSLSTASRSVASRSPRLEPRATKARVISAGYSPRLALKVLTGVALALIVAGPARADLVQLTSSPRGSRLAREAGGEQLARELRIWRIPTYAVHELRTAGVVRRAEPERLFASTGFLETATDPLVGTEWWRPVIGADRQAPPGPGKPVTIVDSGVDFTHPEFSGRANTSVLNEQTTTDENEDHGTEVASVLGAPNNGIGLVGVYPDARLNLWDASPFGFLNEGAAIQGIVEAAHRGPGVINLSFGGEENDPMLADAISLAFRSGSLVVAAAGNEGLEGSPPNFPAFYPHVLTAGATNDNGSVAAFSSISPFVDLAAPGARIPVAEPLAQDPSGYALASGTSFSAPLVAGTAAWIWTRRPDLDHTQLFELMRRSATDIGVRGFDNASGAGLLNIPAALGLKAPTRDPQEPNEKPNEIEPNGVFATGTSPLTQPGRRNALLSARVERNEDPLDLYRAWAPGGMTLQARVKGSVTVRILQRFLQPRGNSAKPLGVGKHGLVRYANKSRRGVYVYVEVRPSVRMAEYTLRLTAARR